MINKFIHICNKIMVINICLVTLVSLIFSLFGSSSAVLYGQIIVNAQEDTNIINGSNTFGSVGFSECRVKPSDDKGNYDQTLENCIIQIVQFFFVVALFIIAIRIGLEALSGLNPFDKSKAIDNTSKLVKDLIIGLILLGSPAILLTLFNTTTLELGTVLSLNRPSSNTETVTSSGNGSSTGGGTNNDLDPEQQGVWIEINNQKYPLNYNFVSFTEIDDIAKFRDANTNLYNYILNNQKLDDNTVKFNQNVSFEDIISTVMSGSTLHDNQRKNLESLLELNNKFKNGTATKTSGSSSAGGSVYTLKTTSCKSSDATADCAATAKFYGVKGVCENEFKNVPPGSANYTISSNIPSLSCYFVPST